MVLPLSKGENVLGFWLLMTGGGVQLVPRVASTGGQWRRPWHISRETYRTMVLIRKQNNF